jgi:hypothetical protein
MVGGCSNVKSRDRRWTVFNLDTGKHYAVQPHVSTDSIACSLFDTPSGVTQPHYESPESLQMLLNDSVWLRVVTCIVPVLTSY